eukprot:PITA_33182
MADQKSSECNIKIEISRPENSESNSVGEPNIFTRSNKIPIWKLVLSDFFRRVWKMGKDDLRKVIHAIKVGLALSVVSLFYLMKPLFNGVGNNAIWAIMTVAVVFEFTAGATLIKGLNRGIGTVLAGSLGVLVGCLAQRAGTVGEPILIAASCFILGASATYLRFFPKIKRKYDYGVVIFILTFNMITVSGYRVDNIFRMAYERLSTIAIGSAISLVISLFVFPIWAGEDLHKSIIKKIEDLAVSIEVCMGEYFEGSDVVKDGSGQIPEAQICQGYRDVLDSKATEDSLATFAIWEPRHGKFRFNHPWKQYVKVGAMIRHMAYCVVALHGCLRSEIQAPYPNRAAFKEPCSKVAAEVAQVLRQLAESINCMKQCPSSESLMESVHDAAEKLNKAFMLQPKIFHVIQPLHSPDQDHYTGELINANSNASENISSLYRQIIHIFNNTEHRHTSGYTGELINANSDASENISSLCRQIIHIFNNTEHRHTSEEDQHKNISGLFSPTANNCLDPPTMVSDVAGETNYISLPSGRLEMSKCTYLVEYAETLPLAAFASLLMELVARLEHVVEAVEDLGKLSAFQPK